MAAKRDACAQAVASAIGAASETAKEYGGLSATQLLRLAATLDAMAVEFGDIGHTETEALCANAALALTREWDKARRARVGRAVARR